MKNKQYRTRYFKCPVCNHIQTATKKANRMTAQGHIKHMTCFHCMEVRPMEQVSEWEKELTET